MLSPLGVRLIVIRASLTVGTLLLDDELLPGVGVYLVYLRQLLLLLLLQLGLLLLVLLQALFALITSQLTVICTFGYCLRLGTAALAL